MSLHSFFCTVLHLFSTFLTSSSLQTFSETSLQLGFVTTRHSCSLTTEHWSLVTVLYLVSHFLSGTVLHSFFVTSLHFCFVVVVQLFSYSTFLTVSHFSSETMLHTVSYTSSPFFSCTLLHTGSVTSWHFCSHSGSRKHSGEVAVAALSSLHCLLGTAGTAVGL